MSVLFLIPIEEGTDLLEGARTIEPLVTQLATFTRRQRTVSAWGIGEHYQCLFSLPPGRTESSWMS